MDTEQNKRPLSGHCQAAALDDFPSCGGGAPSQHPILDLTDSSGQQVGHDLNNKKDHVGPGFPYG